MQVPHGPAEDGNGPDLQRSPGTIPGWPWCCSCRRVVEEKLCVICRDWSSAVSPDDAKVKVRLTGKVLQLRLPWRAALLSLGWARCPTGSPASTPGSGAWGCHCTAPAPGLHQWQPCGLGAVRTISQIQGSNFLLYTCAIYLWK